MKIEVNIEKKHLFILFTAISIVTLCAVAYAYNSNPAVPSNFGHSADEVMVFLTNGSQMSVQNILKNGLFGSCYVDYSNNITLTGSVAAGNYRNKDCPDGYIVTGAYIGGDNSGGGEVEITDLHCSKFICEGQNSNNQVSGSGLVIGELNITYQYSTVGASGALTLTGNTTTTIWGSCSSANHRIEFLVSSVNSCTSCTGQGCSVCTGYVAKPSNVKVLCIS